MTREEAVKVVNVFLELAYFDITKEALTMAIEALKEEPRETAEWVEKRVSSSDLDEFQTAKCSNPKCNCYLTTPYLYSFHDYKYCPSCGAYMGNNLRNKRRNR